MQAVPDRLSELPSFLYYVLLNPAFNVKAAFLLYGAIVVLLLLVLVVAILFVTRSPDEGGVSRPEGRRESVAGDRVSTPRRAKPARTPMGTNARLAVGAGVALVLIAAWALTGYATSDPDLCKSCHWPASEHVKALTETDPHTNVTCVSCHERGGTLGRYLADVPARLIHFADTQSRFPLQDEYGRVTVAACSSCHDAALAGVAANEKRGLRMSHKEPLDASATCVDCHTLRAGVVSDHNAGMAPCLRCHNSKQASTECATCHDERAASAARARTASFTDVQIPDVSCGGCHDEKRDCDWCHGMRLPHSTEFKVYAHARAGAVDFWFNGGRTCGRCHTASRHPCQNCHEELLGHAHGTGANTLVSGHQTAEVKACDTCHRQFAYAATRDFCKDLCHTPAAIAASPR